MRNNLTGLIIATVALSGCSSAPQHSNTLMFGTDTKIALDVSASPASSGSPTITLGYKRVEAVWMPLLANQVLGDEAVPCGNKVETTNGTTTTVKDNIEGCLFQGSDGNNRNDTYSVLASFGADFSGEAKTGSAKGGGGIAQFFATGIAARNLAEKGGAQLVSTTADQPVARKKLPSFEAVGGAYGTIKLCTFPGGTLDQSKWDAIVDQSDVANKSFHKGKGSDLDNWLTNLTTTKSPDLLSLAKSAKSICKS